jgi:hypothetical protein
MAKRFLSLAIAGLIVGGAVTAGLAVSYSRVTPVETGHDTKSPAALTLALDDWSALSPRLTSAIEQAKVAARQRGRTELAEWRRQVMQRVDPGFLDEHLAYLNKRSDDIKWLWRRVLEGKQEADRQYLESVAAALNAKAFDPAQVQGELEHVAHAMAETFTRDLSVTLAGIRGEYGDAAARFDARLEQVVVSGEDRSASLTLKSLLSDADAAGAVAQRVAARIKREMGAADPKAVKLPEAEKVIALVFSAALAAERTYRAALFLGAGKTAAGTIGAAAAGVVVIAAVGGVEWWNHQQHVNEARPRLKEQIQHSLHEFTEATLQDDGRFGAGLNVVSVQLASSIRRQETAWGRWAARMQGFLNL